MSILDQVEELEGNYAGHVTALPEGEDRGQQILVAFACYRADLLTLLNGQVYAPEPEVLDGQFRVEHSADGTGFAIELPERE